MTPAPRAVVWAPPGPVGRRCDGPPGAAGAAGWPPLPHPLRAGRRRPGCDPESGGGNVRGPAAQDEVGELGGGHHVTRPGYDLATLEQCICQVQEKYGVQVYLEPGEAWALNAGYLVTTVLDTLCNGDTSLAILDTSAACHTPDVIEMPYRPPLLDAETPAKSPAPCGWGGPPAWQGM